MNETKRIQLRSYMLEMVDLLAGHRVNSHDRKAAMVVLSKIKFPVLEKIMQSKNGSLKFKPKYKIEDHQG